MRWAGGLVLVCAVACESDVSLEGRPCPCVGGYTCCELTKLCVKEASTCVLELTPGDTRLRLGANQQFKASLPVTWSVDEPNGGSIDSSGEYRAPLRPGTYHVRARTRAGATASSSVIVGPTELTRFIGIHGGKGNADGIGQDARFTAPGSITGDSEYLYLSDYYDPPDDWSKRGYGIRRVSLSTWKVEWLPKDQAQPRGPLAMAGSNLIACTESWDGVERRVVRVDRTTGIVTPLAGASESSDPKDGIGDAARFQKIGAMVGDMGSVYVADGPALRRIDVGTGAVTTLAAGASWKGESLASAQFEGLDAIGLYDGALYAADLRISSAGADGEYPRQTIWRYDLKTGSVTESQMAPSFPAKYWLSTDVPPFTHSVKGFCPSKVSPSGLVGLVGKCVAALDGGFHCAGANFEGPAGMHCRAPDELYITDDYSATLARAKVVHGPWSSVGPEVDTVAGLPPDHDGSTTPGTTMRLKWPEAIAADSTGNIVVAFIGSVLHVDPAMQFGLLENASGPHLLAPLALDGQGNVYLLSSDGDSVVKRALDSGVQSNLFGGSAMDLAHDGQSALYVNRFGELIRIDTITNEVAPVAQGDFGPIAVDGERSVFAARKHAHSGYSELVRIDAASGKVALLPPPPDGWHATALAYDPAGVLYVAEEDHQRIRGLIVETGEVFHVVGKLGSQGVQLGPLPASLNKPIDIALLPDGSLAIADYAENVVLVAK